MTLHRVYIINRNFWEYVYHSPVPIKQYDIAFHQTYNIFRLLRDKQPTTLSGRITNDS